MKATTVIIAMFAAQAALEPIRTPERDERVREPVRSETPNDERQVEDRVREAEDNAEMARAMWLRADWLEQRRKYGDRIPPYEEYEHRRGYVTPDWVYQRIPAALGNEDENEVTNPDNGTWDNHVDLVERNPDEFPETVPWWKVRRHVR